MVFGGEEAHFIIAVAGVLGATSTVNFEIVGPGGVEGSVVFIGEGGVM